MKGLGVLRPWPLALVAVLTTASAGGHAGVAIADLAAGTLNAEAGATAAVWVLVAVAAVALWGYVGERA